MTAYSYVGSRATCPSGLTRMRVAYTEPGGDTCINANGGIPLVCPPGRVVGSGPGGYFCYPSRSRSSPSLSGWTSTAADIGKGLFGVFTSGEQAKGAAAALQAQQQANVMAAGGGGGIMGFSPMTLLLLGGVGIGAYMLLKKKKPA